MSDKLDRTELTPPPKLSESNEERKLWGHTVDISRALASNNIVDPRLEDNYLKPVSENALYTHFSRVDEEHVHEEKANVVDAPENKNILEGVNITDWSQNSDFKADTMEEKENTDLPKKRELSISPSTPVGPINKERKDLESFETCASPILRDMTAGKDRNIVLKTRERGRFNSVSDGGYMPKTPNDSLTRSNSFGGMTRKKRCVKRKLIPGQALLPAMFSGLFKPCGAKYDDGKDAENNKDDGPDDSNE